MKKIKILFYSHTIDYAGTWRSHERIILNLDKDLFDPYVFYNPNKDNNRLDFLKNKLPNGKVIPFDASLNKLGSEYGYPYENNNFSELAKLYNFDIIHFARSGYYEWPFTERISPLQIETNIFGYRDQSNFLDCSIAICETIKNLRGGCDEVIYNPIPKKIEDSQNIKKEYNIPHDYIVFGRIGRPAHFHPISLLSLNILKEKMGFHKFKYIVVGACENFKSTAKNLKLIDDCVFISETNDDNLIHKFYNTIDIFLHYRGDGECHSTAISQSLSYGKPVISHYAGYNGQSETIKDGGFVCVDEYEYCENILKLITHKDTYDEVSKNAMKRSLDFDLDNIVDLWSTLYMKLYKNKIKN